MTASIFNDTVTQAIRTFIRKSREDETTSRSKPGYVPVSGILSPDTVKQLKAANLISETDGTTGGWYKPSETLIKLLGPDPVKPFALNKWTRFVLDLYNFHRGDSIELTRRTIPAVMADRIELKDAVLAALDAGYIHASGVSREKTTIDQIFNPNARDTYYNTELTDKGKRFIDNGYRA